LYVTAGDLAPEKRCRRNEFSVTRRTRASLRGPADKAQKWRDDLRKRLKKTLIICFKLALITPASRQSLFGHSVIGGMEPKPLDVEGHREEGMERTTRLLVVVTKAINEYLNGPQKNAPAAI
jgi:hypothetical protein